MDADLPLAAVVQLAVGRSPVVVELDLSSELIPLAIEASIAFIVFEAVSNALKHAQANKLRVKTWIEDGRIVTEIEDNGIGGAIGLRKLRNRARAARGTVEIDSPSGVGTLIRAEIPLATRKNRSQ